MRFQEPAFEDGAAGEVDLRGLVRALRRRARTVGISVLVAFVGASAFVNFVSPRFTAQTSILLENQETFFTRPDRVNLPADVANQLDPEAVASQVQLINSPDLARRAIRQLNLAGNPEFDPIAGGVNPLKQVLIFLGLADDPSRLSPDQRLATKFLDQLLVYSPSKTRVLAIEFTSRDPVLAARVTNTIAQLYLQEQSSAKRGTARQAAEALAAQVTDLRAKLIAADEERERYRVKTGLLGGGTTTISNQQLADINGDLSKARATQADASAKSALIRELIREGKTTDVADIVNNDLVRRVADQRYAAQAMLAREGRTLLPAHPRIKELAAQVSEYDAALKQAARQAADSLENEAKIAGLRVANLEAALTQQKTVAGTADADAVHLRALERIAQSYKDQLDSSTTKYQEALARQNSTATPADARIISSATPPQEPSFPKKLPIIVFATLAALVFSAGYVVASELMGQERDVPEQRLARVATRGTAEVVRPQTKTTPRAADDSGARRQAWVFPEPAQEPPVAEPPQAVADRASPSRTRSAPAGFAGPIGDVVQRAAAFLRGFGRSAADARDQRAPADDPVLPPISSEQILARLAGRAAARKTAERTEATGTSDDAHANAISADSAHAPESVADVPGIDTIEAAVERIVAAHVPGRGLHVIGIGLGNGAARISIDLARRLSQRGRSILVDLDHAPDRLAELGAPGRAGRAAVASLKGLSELLQGATTFAEVIQKDHATRLHFIPSGQAEAEFEDFDLIIEALSETYDFVMMLPPDHPQMDVARAMAPFADFVVLARAARASSQVATEVERDLLAAGAAEVIAVQARTTPSRAVA